MAHEHYDSSFTLLGMVAKHLFRRLKDFNTAAVHIDDGEDVMDLISDADRGLHILDVRAHTNINAHTRTHTDTHRLLHTRKM